MTTDDKPDKAEKAKVYAAYDDTYLRFVGGTYDSKEKATKAARERGVKKFTVREV